MAALVHLRLRETFRRPLGLGDPAVPVVDPAVGVGAFPAAVFAVAPERSTPVLAWDLDGPALEAAARIVPPPGLVPRPGNALDEAPSAVLAAALRSTTSRPGPTDASEVPPAVVLGNPPWAGKSASRGGPTDELIADLRRDALGEPLRERKLGVLSDDYVRFLRWGAEVVRRAPGGGVLCLVTNSSFLLGPVHRGLRGALLRWFAGVDLLDLGGGSLTGRRSGQRGSARDESLFQVRPGAVVTLAWRPPGHVEDPTGARRGALRLARLAGRRGDKRAWLWTAAGELEGRGGEAAARLGWVPGDGAPPACWFRPAPPPRALEAGGRRAPSAWESLLPLDALVPFHREGIQTNRDALATAADRGTLLERLHRLASGAPREGFVPGSGAARGPSGPSPILEARPHFDPGQARARLRAALDRDPSGGALLRRMSYRPGEPRWLYAETPLCHRPRPALLAAFDQGDAGGRGAGALVTVRKDPGDRAWAHVGWVPHPPDSSWLSSRSACRTRAFPPWAPDGTENLDRAGLRQLGPGVPPEVGPLDVLLFALAVFFSPGYRRRYGAELALGYPRLPRVTTPAQWRRGVHLGRSLRAAFVALEDGGDPSAPEGASSSAAAGGGPPPGAADLVDVGHRRVPLRDGAALAREADRLLLALGLPAEDEGPGTPGAR